MKSSVIRARWVGLEIRFREYVPHPPLYSLQYAPIKNAALFKGALVAPSSLTFGIEGGRGAGSRKGWDEDSPGWKVLIVVAAVGVICALCEHLGNGLAVRGPGHSHFWKHSSDATGATRWGSSTRKCSLSPVSFQHPNIAHMVRFFVGSASVAVNFLQAT
jgi:hypothetical protein